MSIVTFSVVIGVLAFVIGVLFLVAPGTLRRLNDISAKMVARIDSFTFSYRIGFGVSLMLISIFMFFMAYYFTKRH
ncbi:MAG: hypothetical protein HY755_08040 [Nitrospirae bacterium]|nr:hypothetical protein [Nitrospirota bacterium]